MTELRKQFEALPSIKTFLMSFDYDEKSNEYIRSKLFTQPDYTLGFFNGAWYAFQEQQKNIDELKNNLRLISDKVDDVHTELSAYSNNETNWQMVFRKLELIEVICNESKPQ